MSHVFLTVYLIADGGYEDGHEGADQVEDAIGQIGQGGYSKHGGLGHTAGVPRYQHGDNSGGVFDTAAQQPTFQSALIIQVTEEIARQDDGDVLVACGQVEEESRADSGAHYADGAADHADEYLRDGGKERLCLAKKILKDCGSSTKPRVSPKEFPSTRSALAQTRKLLTNFSKNSFYLLPEPLRRGYFLTNY